MKTSRCCFRPYLLPEMKRTRQSLLGEEKHVQWSVAVEIQGFWPRFEKRNEVVIMVWRDEGDGVRQSSELWGSQLVEKERRS